MGWSELRPAWPFSAGVLNHGRLSRSLQDWIGAFQPEVIYTILGSVGYAELVRAVQKRFQIPVVMHFMDEGATDPVGESLLSSWARRRYGKILRTVLAESAARMAICERMSAAYSERFGLPCDTFMNTVDMEKYPPREHLERGEVLRLVYTGAVLPYSQQQSLLEICRAVADLHEQGVRIRLDIYASFQLFGDSLGRMSHPDCVYLHEAIKDDALYFQTLKQADILVSPVNFDARSIRFIRYSMPTKIPSYLCSGTPILVYGPPGIAQTEYAEKEKWGHLVSRRDPAALKQAIQLLSDSAELREALSRAAVSAARKNHDSAHVRERFRAVFSRAAAHG